MQCKNKSLKEELLEILSDSSPARIFLVTGKTSFAASGAKDTCDQVLEGVALLQYSDFSVNPKIEDIQKGIAEFKHFAPDLVIAIGGGSVIDTAKAVTALAQCDDDIAPYIKDEKGLKKMREVPLVAVPTTAGAGAEATHFAVVYIENKKYSLTHPTLLPDRVIFDSSLLLAQSSKQRAISGVDALAQSIESLWSKNATTESKQYAKDALTLIYRNLESFVENNDFSASSIQHGAYLAGKAINISKTTASHAMSYALTKNYGIPHGHAVILTLPALMIFNSADAEEAMLVIKDVLQTSGTEESAEKIIKLVNRLGLETSLKSFGIAESDISGLVNQMSVERAANNPRSFSSEDARVLLKQLI